ncbi:MAG: RimK family alpha-L-glutamate ligase, partial [Pirellulaceae bacterium]
MAALRTIALLGNPYGWYARDLARAAALRGIELLPVSFEHLETSLGDAGLAGLRLPAASSRIAPDLDHQIPLDPRMPGCPDLLLVRSMPMGSLEQVIFRVNALHQMASHGLQVVNSPRSLEIAIDKWLTLRLLQERGLPIPTTICCQTRRQALEGWELLGRRCVVKPVFGSEGRGIIRVEDPDIAWRVFGALEQTRSLIYLQQFLESPGYDLRLLVIDGQVHSVRRMGVGGDWRNNLSRGGTAEAWEASSGERQLAIEA